MMAPSMVIKIKCNPILTKKHAYSKTISIMKQAMWRNSGEFWCGII